MKKEVITTYLEICDRDSINAKISDDSQFRIGECTAGQWQFNKFLYKYVGGPWQWKEKLSFTAQQWIEYVQNPNVRTWVAYQCGSIAGYYELVKDEENDVEIRYFGMTPEFIGKGFGGAMLTAAIRSGFDWQAKRVWVHTCTLDHENAKANYISRGMRVYKEETE